MSEDNITPIQRATLDAMKRVLSRITTLHNGYIIILRAIRASLTGDEEMKKNIDALNKNLKEVDMDSEHYFLSILFVDLISEIEIYFTHVIKAVIEKHPKKLGSTSFKLNEIIDAESIDTLVTKAAEEYLNKLMYKKPMEYLSSICELLSIEHNELSELWKYYIEAKARRDLGVHNRWSCNTTYLRKLEEAGIESSAKENDYMFPTYDKYLINLLDKLGLIVNKITQQVCIKYA